MSLGGGRGGAGVACARPPLAADAERSHGQGPPPTLLENKAILFARTGKVEKLADCLAHGVSANLPGLIQNAAERGRLEAVQFLLARGADYARKHRREDVIAALEPASNGQTPDERGSGAYPPIWNIERSRVETPSSRRWPVGFAATARSRICCTSATPPPERRARFTSSSSSFSRQRWNLPSAVRRMRLQEPQ